MKSSTYIPNLPELPSDIMANRSLCIGAWARASFNHTLGTHWLLPEADQFCTVGAIYRAFGVPLLEKGIILEEVTLDSEVGQYIKWLSRIVKAKPSKEETFNSYTSRLIFWSDAPKRTHCEVVTALRTTEINLGYRASD